MHTFKGSHSTIHHNSGLDGDVTIHDDKEGKVEIPAEDLLRFVAEWVTRQRVAELEDAHWTDVFGLRGTT